MSQQVTSLSVSNLLTLQNTKRLLKQFWEENPILYQILRDSHHLDECREKVFHYLADYERKLFGRSNQHARERAIAKMSLNVLKNCFSRRSEKIAETSSLEILLDLAHGKPVEFSAAFIMEFSNLFKSAKMKTGFFNPGPAQQPINIYQRTELLNQASRHLSHVQETYFTGLSQPLNSIRQNQQSRLIKLLGATQEQWNDWQWQYRNVIRSLDSLKRLIKLSSAEEEALAMAEKSHIPFAVTPYHLSLLDPDTTGSWDRSLRVQVLPPMSYVKAVIQARDSGKSLDFMQEGLTSPIAYVTRRYPQIAIFKPYNTCAQICVYCQRNWEITKALAPEAKRPKTQLEQALEWFAANPEVTEILVTGGDPALLPDGYLEEILERIAAMPQIRRIRIGTRTPVVLPMRITEKFADLLAKYRIPGEREVCLMTHFEHASEITPESRDAVSLLRSRSIPVYNQSVFTMENSRRFEMVALRKALRLIGVDPYYTFNLKGKGETKAYQVPIARLLQEQAEEARMSPGLDRTDEPVFNVPRLGKTYLKSGQDHEVIQILPDGRRLYEFFPWPASPEEASYFHADAPIYSYLQDLRKRGENIEDYQTIWYYY